LQCFGGLLARRDGALVDHSSLRPRVRALLAILALNHPDPVHVDVVIEQLWPDTDYEAATHRMQTAVSSLRRALERGSAERGPAVQRRGSAYFLDGAHTDIEDFHGALRAAASARASGDRDEEASALRRALLVHRGDLLSEFGPAEWLVRERERLGLLAANAAEHLAVMELDAGNASAAVAIAVRGIGWDRYRESLWQVVDEATGAGAEGAAGDALRALHDRTWSAQPI
jgi:DNA-binding SARP family transcriptional activator